MILEDLYRVFLDGQFVELQYETTQKILWSGIASSIPTEYLDYSVKVVMSCATTSISSKILIIIA